jgi:DNA-binding NtrC family response regulator
MRALTYPVHPILIVDDEDHFLLSVELSLSTEGINNIQTCNDSRKVAKLLKNTEFSMVMLDINMPYISGFEILQSIVAEYSEIPVIIISAIKEVEQAVECMKIGAFDYILKPVDVNRLVTTCRRGLDLTTIKYENRMLKEYLLSDQLQHPAAFEHIITKSESMRAIFKYVEAIAKTPLPILITGETGVGKELIASAIHTISGRNGELVPVNVAGVDDTLFSDTLFGHKKGAFSGAEADRKGLIEQAEQGTLFLDEIGDLSLESQVKLLRLLQDGKYYPLGSDMAKLSDARIVVATHRDIEQMKKNNGFRQDLYYRLRAHHIKIPALRERKEDIPLLVNHFLKSAAETLNKKPPTPPRELYTFLANHNFPGNIRELEGLIFDAISRHQSGVLSLNVFREKISLKENSSNNITDEESGIELITFPDNLPTLQEAEFILIAEALKRAKGNQRIAAELLGISRTALNNRLKRLI